MKKMNPALLLCILTLEHMEKMKNNAVGWLQGRPECLSGGAVAHASPPGPSQLELLCGLDVGFFVSELF